MKDANGGIMGSKLCAHFKELCQRHKLLVTLFVCALLFDTYSTIHFMQEVGIEYECHPLVRYSAAILGPVIGVILVAFVYKFIAAMCLAMYLQKFRVFILIIPTVTSTIAGYINLHGGFYP